eukprot:TRINITY_DN34702_c0_g1_i1.p1 TRINITY_DN34702_c0_g1~~TRINITY_DN34702_c0_g1_i1.p1  ORF type:complete len:289 (+),score=54.53 TRINITY_DN34702_c0_g1_i1:33-899(+)
MDRLLLVVLLAALATSLGSETAEARLAKKHFSELKPDTFGELVYKSEHIWVVLFSRDRHSTLRKEIEQASSNLKGIARFGWMDCTTGAAQRIAEKLGVTSYPTVWFQDSDGKREIVDKAQHARKELVDFVVAHIPMHVEQLTDADSFAETMSSAVPNVLLFTEKLNTTLLYKALAAFYHPRLQFAEIRNCPELQQTYKVEKLPTLLVRTNSRTAPTEAVYYGGALNYDALMAFLDPYANPPPRSAELDTEVPKAKEKVLPNGLRFDASALTADELGPEELQEILSRLP